MAAQFLASKIALHRSILAMLELKEEWAKDGATGHSGQRVRLEEWGDDIWLQQFRFTQYEVNRLVVALDLPEKVTCPSNGITEDRVTALCMLLRRLAYPIRLADAELFLGWEPSRFSRISTITALYLWHRWKHLLRFDPIRLSPAKLASFGEFVAQKGAPLEDVVAFLDGTLRKMARPVQNQRMVYNGWKRMHCLKFHLLLTPDGIVIHVYGPVEGRRHDETVYQQSGLKDLLRIHFCDEEGRQLFIYGDSGYACKGQVLSPFKGPALTEKQIQWNNAMSKVREPVEWVFGEVIRQFPFLDFSRNQKLLLQPCGLWYLVGILLCNAHTILHQPQTSQYFHCPPPTLEEYFHGEALGDDEMDAWCNSSPWMEMDEEDIDSDSDDTDDR